MQKRFGWVYHLKSSFKGNMCIYSIVLAVWVKLICPPNDTNPRPCLSDVPVSETEVLRYGTPTLVWECVKTYSLLYRLGQKAYKHTITSLYFISDHSSRKGESVCVHAVVWCGVAGGVSPSSSDWHHMPFAPAAYISNLWPLSSLHLVASYAHKKGHRKERHMYIS